MNIVPNLGIKVDQHCICNTSNISNPTEKVIKKYKKRPSNSMNKKTASCVNKEAEYSFTYFVTSDDISK